MLSLVLTLLVLIAIFFIQQSYPLLAGILAVAPVKIIATAVMTYEDGGTARLHDAIGGMLIGQVAWGILLLAAWIALR